MALARRLAATLSRRAVYTPACRLQAAQSRSVVSTTARLDESDDADVEPSQEQPDDEPSSSPVDTEKANSSSVKARPYFEELREVMAAKYLSNQPLPKPHALCSKTSQKLTLPDLRVQYANRLSLVRKQYQSEIAQKKAAKDLQDKKQREAMLLAKEERLRLKKEKSARRALEVQEENRLLQEQLAKETAERRAHRKLMDMKLEKRRQTEKDIIRQQSGTWIEEKDLEARIVEAISNPIEL